MDTAEPGTQLLMEPIDTAKPGAQPWMEPMDTTVRPNMNKGPEVVRFGIFFTELYDVAMQASSYTADITLNFQWNDPRAIGVGQQMEHLELSQEDASKLIWMPDMAIVNHDIKGTEIISTEVLIYPDGNVSKTQRLLAKLKNPFDIDTYPFDDQTLKVIISSTKYFTDDLRLEAMTCNVSSEAFVHTGFSLKSTNVTVVEESLTGGAKKSRGMLTLKMHHSTASAWRLAQTGLVLVACGNFVFWMPLIPQFTMPRLAMSVISLLSMMSMRSSYLTSLAGLAGTSLGEAFFTNGTVFFFTVVVLNGILDFVAYELEKHDLAARINWEVRAWLPIFYLVCVLQCYFFRRSGAIESLVVLVLFLCRCFIGVRLSANGAAEEDSKAAAAVAEASAPSS
jgi:hypothetical protein